MYLNLKQTDRSGRERTPDTNWHNYCHMWPKVWRFVSGVLERKARCEVDIWREGIFKVHTPVRAHLK